MISPENILMRLNDLREMGKYCDVIFHIGEQKFFCHRAILAAATTYFDGMFGNNFKESENRDVDLKDVDEHGFRVLLEYIYTGKAELDNATVKQALSVATYFGIECLTEKCVKHVIENINSKNVLEYHLFADSNGCTLLKNFTTDFIRESFTNIAKTNDFMEVPYSIIKELISDNYIFVNKEEFVFETIIQWINHEWKNRSQYITELIKEVRFKFVNPEYIFNEVFKNNLVLDAIDNNIKVIINNKIADSSPRKSRKSVHMFGKRKCSDGTWEIAVVRWNSLLMKDMTHMNIKRDISTIKITCCSSHIYMFTYNTTNKEKNFSYFNDTGEWTPLKILDLNIPILNMASLNSFNSIYANVSFDVPPLSTPRDFNIYCYITELDTWNSLGASGYVAASGYNIHNAALTSYNGTIYSCGGMDYNNNLLHAVRLLDPRVGKWVSMNSMPETTSYAAATTLNDKIYVTGGWTGNNTINKVQMYDIVANKWLLVNPIRVQRHLHCLVPHHNKLYAIGGKKSLVEIYDPTLDSWCAGPDIEIFQDNIMTGSCF